MKSRDVPPAPGSHFTVLIADLEGDDERLSQTSHVEAALAGHEGLEVVRIGSGPRLADTGSRTERQLEAERQARARLEDKNGDVLIFGEVAEANRRLRLRFIARNESLQGGARSYALEAAELPKDFSADFNAALLAWVAVSVAPATEQAGQYVADLLKPAAGKLRHLCAHMPAGSRRGPARQPGAFLRPRRLGARRADRRERLAGAGARRLSRRPGGLDARARAAATGPGPRTTSATRSRRSASARTAPNGWTRRSPPIAPPWRSGRASACRCEWAMTQNNLGNALRTLGEREDGTHRLEQAVAAYRAALEVWTRERVPLQWAMTQNNLGNALRTLGEREDGTERLDEAVAAYRARPGGQDARARAARLGHDPEQPRHRARERSARARTAPNGWSEAVAAYRAALEVWTRERVPLDWATTQNNLGNALQTLGAREDGTQRLEQAVAAYRAALEVRTRERVPLQWATTQNNLGNALRTLGEREDGTAAAGAGGRRLSRRPGGHTRERVPLDWATTQNNLGTALRTLGEREDGTAAAGRGGRRLSRRPGGQDARARAAAMGDDPEQPRQRAPDARRARGRHRNGWKRRSPPIAPPWRSGRASACRSTGPGPRTTSAPRSSALGEREDGTERLEEAVAAYRAALEVFGPAGASYYVSGTERNLARAEALLAERRGKSAAE